MPPERFLPFFFARVKAVLSEKEHLSPAAHPGDGFSSNGQWFQVEHRREKNTQKKQPSKTTARTREHQTAVRHHLTSHFVNLLNAKTKKL